MTILLDATFVECIAQATRRAEVVRDDAASQHTGAAREAALAITALEEAQMRFTRAIAKRDGRFDPVDLEKLSDPAWAEERKRFVDDAVAAG